MSPVFLHEKFQLIQNGVKVEFATYTLHSKNGELQSMSGEFYSLENVNTTPTISKQQAFEKALRQIGAKTYLWENPADAAAFNYTMPEGELVLLPVSDNQVKKGESNLKLAYKFDIYFYIYLYLDKFTRNITQFPRTSGRLCEVHHHSRPDSRSLCRF